MSSMRRLTWSVSLALLTWVFLPCASSKSAESQSEAPTKRQPVKDGTPSSVPERKKQECVAVSTRLGTRVSTLTGYGAHEGLRVEHPSLRFDGRLTPAMQDLSNAVQLLGINPIFPVQANLTNLLLPAARPMNRLHRQLL
jgi:hypothetical protein